MSDLVAKEDIELAPPSPGFYSRLFVTPKVTGGWRPVIDLSHLNGWVDVSHFHMETTNAVLQSLRLGVWMVSLDLEDAYLQVLVHPSSRRYLGFCMGDSVYQFPALCFGLSMAFQAFTHVMAPVSSIMHCHGFQILRYLRRLAGPCFNLSGDCLGEGLPPLSLSSTGDSCESSKELFGSALDSGLFRNDTNDFSFEGFPDPQKAPEVVPFPSGVSLRPPTPCVGLAPVVGGRVTYVCAGSGSPASYEARPALLQRCGVPPSVGSWDDCCLPDLLWWSENPICGQVFLSARIAPTCSCSRTPRTQVGGLLSATSISQTRGLPCAPNFQSTTGSFLRCFMPCKVFYLLCGIVWWRCTPTTPQPWRTFGSRVALGLKRLNAIAQSILRLCETNPFDSFPSSFRGV